MGKKIVYLMLFLLVAGCSAPIKEGEVCGKKHEPERTYVQYISVYNGKTTTVIPYTVYDDEDWLIQIRAFDEEKNKERYITFYVSEDVYSKLRVSDWFVYDPGVHKTGDQNRRVRK